MKLAVLSDIHANLPAFEAVLEDVRAWRPDAVVFAGDGVNRGARPAECWTLLAGLARDEGWQLLRGNHEEYVASREGAALTPPDSPAFQIAQSSLWTYRRLGLPAATLADLPFSLSLLAPDGGEVRVTHASMLGTRQGIYPDSSDEAIRERVGRPAPGLFAAGHTHRPFVRHLDDTLVVNPGSVGLPFDGDPRAAYARCAWRTGGWRADIRRLEYDRAAAEAAFQDTGFLDGGGPLARIMLRELQTARSLINHWLTAYEADCLAGRIGVMAAVERFLAER
ncbi:MAG: metallophosphoesterase family protein [Anaerolineae bacterium]